MLVHSVTCVCTCIVLCLHLYYVQGLWSIIAISCCLLPPFYCVNVCTQHNIEVSVLTEPLQTGSGWLLENSENSCCGHGLQNYNSAASYIILGLRMYLNIWSTRAQCHVEFDCILYYGWNIMRHVLYCSSSNNHNSVPISRDMLRDPCNCQGA